MRGTKRSWTGRAAVAAMAMALIANAALAAVGAPEVEKLFVPSAASLVRFYPTQLSSTPTGTVEDQAVWLAKVQGLMAGAPSLLQHSLLMSQTKQEFSSNVMLLQQLQSGSMKQSALGLRTQVKTSRVTAQALGDLTNLVYRELEPCRIMDTRSASGASGVQGPIAGGSLKQIPGFITAGTDWSQYGQTAPLSDCGLNSNYGGTIYAVAIVITILNPNFDAFLGVGDVANLNTTLSTVALNFTHGQGLSTLYIVPQGASNTIYFAMPAALSAHLIFDVVGFFHKSDATALDCLYPNVAGTGTIPNGSLITLAIPSCAAGYTKTGAACYQAGVFGSVPLVEVSLNFYNDCIWNNNSGSTATGSNFHAETACCRVPGR